MSDIDKQILALLEKQRGPIPFHEAVRKGLPEAVAAMAKFKEWLRQEPKP